MSGVLCVSGTSPASCCFLPLIFGCAVVLAASAFAETRSHGTGAARSTSTLQQHRHGQTSKLGSWRGFEHALNSLRAQRVPPGIPTLWFLSKIIAETGESLKEIRKDNYFYMCA